MLEHAQASSAHATANQETNVFKESIVVANADIWNASNFRVSLKIWVTSIGIDFNAYMRLLGRKKFMKPRSYAIMCGDRSKNRRKQEKQTRKFGKRLDGDFLIRFERHESNSTDASKFPTYTFDFSDQAININYVELTIDVSCIHSL